MNGSSSLALDRLAQAGTGPETAQASLPGQVLDRFDDLAVTCSGSSGRAETSP